MQAVLPIVRDACANGNQVLSILASWFAPDSLDDRRLVEALNHPNVWRVGNHRVPATNSLVACGLSPDKAVAYDFARARQPDDYVTKKLDPAKTIKMFFAGQVIASKGVFDIINSVRLLRSHGRDVRLTIAGSGNDLAECQKRASNLGGSVRFLGRIGNQDVLKHLCESTYSLVPTHDSFPEGMPQTLTESLATRTPTIISDHKVFTSTFKDKQGVRIVKQRSPESICQTIEEISGSPEEYSRLSQTTHDAFQLVECPYLMEDLIREWATVSGIH